LAEQEFAISGSTSFKDHHVYQQSDIAAIEEQAAFLGSKALVTTAKDAVKLTDLEFTLPCFVIEISLSISNPAAFRDLILSS
jgi:tetraacyldisaccharide 4'-kinase